MLSSLKYKISYKSVASSPKAFYHYQPMIKFVYSHDSPLEIIDSKAEESNIHPCSGSINLFPSSDECLSVKDWESKFYKPFIVQKYVSPKSPLSSAKKVISKPFEAKTNSAAFTRPLKSNEVEFISALPKQFQYKPLEENEIELINGGGVTI